jgi:glutamate-1-semialdehyde 2,1-aminomutase
MSTSQTPKSAALYESAKKVMPGGNTRHTVFRNPHQVYADRGEGCRIIDIDGNSRIDAVGNFTSLIHGYGCDAIKAAAREQLEKGFCFGMATPGEVRLSELLTERLPSVEHVRYCNSGTEAVMNAVKIARAFTGRAKIAKCEGAYHGTYDVVETSQEARPENWGEIDAPNSVATAAGTPQGLLDDVVIIPFNNIELGEKILRAKANDLAGVLVDVMPNRAGLVPAKPEFLEMLRRVTREIGALLIFDEVITFRLGYNGAQGRYGINPDITALGKIIGGGFPIGAIAGRVDVMAVYDPTHGAPKVQHGGTFSANPMSMVAGIAALEALTPEVYAHLEALGERFQSSMTALFEERGMEAQVTGLGSLRRIHLNKAKLSDFRSTILSGADGAAKVAALSRKLYDEGVIIAANGLVCFSTPMTFDDIDEIVAAFDRSLTTL